MRGLQLLSIMILGLSCPIAHALESSLTEDQKPTAPPQANLDLKHVIYKSEQQAKAIDSDIRLYSVIKQDIDTAGSEGGTLTAYYAANSLRKVVVTYYAEMGQIEYQYYRGKQGLLGANRDYFWLQSKRADMTNPCTLLIPKLKQY